MDKDAKINLVFIVMFAITFITLSVYLIFAGQDSTSEFSVNNTTIQEDSIHIFNFTINHSGSSAFTRNLTDVNITLPPSFNFDAGSNGTGNLSAVDGYQAVSFSNTSSSTDYFVLSWNGTSLTDNIVTVNGTAGFTEGKNHSFLWFNASGSTPGLYNITVSRYYNNTGIGNTTNHTVIINDTTIPFNINFSNINRTYPNISGSFSLNLSVYDNGNFSLSNDVFTEITEVNLTVYNSTALINASYNLSNVTKASSLGNYWNVTIDTTTFPEGLYNFSITAKDTRGNFNVTNITNVLIDNTAPTASVSCSPSTVNTGDTVTCTCSPADSLSGVDPNATSIVANPETSNTGVFTHSCSFADQAGNTGTASTTYTIELVGGGGGGGGGGSSTSFYKKTITVSKDLNSTSVNQKLGEKERIKINIDGSTHHIGVRQVSLTSATVEITSTPVQFDLSIGEEKKIDLDDDNDYDVVVKLVSIVNGDADLSISYLMEEYIPICNPDWTCSDWSECVDGNRVRTCSDSNNCGSNEGKPSESESCEENEVLETLSMNWIWILLVIVLIVAGWIYYKRNY